MHTKYTQPNALAAPATTATCACTSMLAVHMPEQVPTYLPRWDGWRGALSTSQPNRLQPLLVASHCPATQPSSAQHGSCVIRHAPPHTHTHTRACLCVRACVHANMHTRTRTRTHARTHTARAHTHTLTAPCTRLLPSPPAGGRVPGAHAAPRPAGALRGGAVRWRASLLLLLLLSSHASPCEPNWGNGEPLQPLHGCGSILHMACHASVAACLAA